MKRTSSSNQPASTATSAVSMATLEVEIMASRMLSKCDTTTPAAFAKFGTIRAVFWEKIERKSEKEKRKDPFTGNENH